MHARTSNQFRGDPFLSFRGLLFLWIFFNRLVNLQARSICTSSALKIKIILYSMSSSSSPIGEDEVSLLDLANTYAAFLREKLAPHLKRVVNERDALLKDRKSYGLLLKDMEKFNNPAFKDCVFPPRVGWSEDKENGILDSSGDMEAPLYLTPTPDPNAASLVVGRSQRLQDSQTGGGEGMFVEVGLNFFVQLKTPSEVSAVVTEKMALLDDMLERVEGDIVRVRGDVQTVLDNLEKIGGSVRLEEGT